MIVKTTWGTTISVASSGGRADGKSVIGIVLEIQKGWENVTANGMLADKSRTSPLFTIDAHDLDVLVLDYLIYRSRGAQQYGVEMLMTESRCPYCGSAEPKVTRRGERPMEKRAFCSQCRRSYRIRFDIVETTIPEGIA